MTALPDIAIGAIAAAMITGGIALVTLVGGKENTTSEFRQAWIDALRADTARLIAHAHVLEGMIGVKFKDREAIWTSGRENSAGFVEAGNAIRMRLNPGEDDTQRVLRHLHTIEDLLAFSPGPPKELLRAPARGAVPAECRHLAEAVGVILRKDWARVKRGERTYLFVVALAGAMFCIGFVNLWIGVAARPAATTQSAPSGASTSVSVNVAPIPERPPQAAEPKAAPP